MGRKRPYHIFYRLRTSIFRPLARNKTEAHVLANLSKGSSALCSFLGWSLCLFAAGLGVCHIETSNLDELAMATSMALFASSPSPPWQCFAFYAATLLDNLVLFYRVCTLCYAASPRDKSVLVFVCSELQGMCYTDF